jgi:hypothetical protein
MTGIAGIWDLRRSGGSLGTLLILLEELQIQRRIHDADAIHVIIVPDATDLVDGMSSERTDARRGALHISDFEKLRRMAEVSCAMSDVADCHVCIEQAAIRDVKNLLRIGCVPWPDPELLVRGKQCYDSTRMIQEFYSQAGNIPRLSVRADLVAWANAYMKERSRGRLSVAVHLKNNPQISGQSNANIDSWLTFMSDCQNEYEIQFFLVGDDPTDARFRGLLNVTIAQDDRLTLERHLALIQVAGLFMGMMSGPANMALFGKNPYLIFKNPDHHAREMAAELGENDHYPFALPHQRVLRAWDTTENLAAAFDNVIRQVVA